MATLTWQPGRPVDVSATLGGLRRGGADPTYRHDPGGALWRTTTTPSGSATIALQVSAEEVFAEAWGPGAQWALDRVPDSLGAADDVSGFAPPPGHATETWRRRPGHRVPRTGRVWDVLLAAILEQKVTGTEAHRSWRNLIAVAGTPAPGPIDGLRVVPTPEALLEIPDWTWHHCGVDGARRRALRAAATVAGRLEEAVELPPAQALARLRAVPGVGLWTAAEVAQRALGDADTVSVGDYHLASFVGWALVGHKIDDQGMLELLAPYQPHRYRVVRMLELSGFRKPRFGPRMSVRDYRAV